MALPGRSAAVEDRSASVSDAAIHAAALRVAESGHRRRLSPGALGRAAAERRNRTRLPKNAGRPSGGVFSARAGAEMIGERRGVRATWNATLSSGSRGWKSHSLPVCGWGSAIFGNEGNLGNE